MSTYLWGSLLGQKFLGGVHILTAMCFSTDQLFKGSYKWIRNICWNFKNLCWESFKFDKWFLCQYFLNVTIWVSFRKIHNLDNFRVENNKAHSIHLKPLTIEILPIKWKTLIIWGTTQKPNKHKLINDPLWYKSFPPVKI